MTTTSEGAVLSPKCVGTTGDAFCKTIADYHRDETRNGQQGDRYKRHQSNHFREAQFSSDGTTIVTQNEDQHLRTFLLPSDLLEGSEQPHTLIPGCSKSSPSTIQSYALYPHFALEDPSTTVALSASKDLPISLFNIVHTGFVHAKYPLVNPTTEAFVAPNSLCWARDGSHFVAGSRDQISVFDASYDGSGPILTHRTAPGKAEKKEFGRSGLMGCGGIIGALSVSSDGVLAAGTMNREVALYAGEGSGECGTAFSLGAGSNGPSGKGVTQLSWSPCGTYLLIAERQSDVLHVYDMRNMMDRVSWLSGRKADTTQRLGFHVIPTAGGFEAWTGGTDGCVRMWSNPGHHGGECVPDEVMKLHDDPVCSTVWHPSGAVLATCSGKRINTLGLGDEIDGDGGMSMESQSSTLDNRLKVWLV